ncbi:unnamed protein product [Leptidea sinapis]|uniref:Uncharacterized protein n=1 Tax=Leptidea sinapis TaxID=189913 RepID=A0A5E4Q6Q5_9NEOP|nr:unnamed protein product [Leptidea sinapis]
MPVHQINVKNSSEIESWEWGGGCGKETVRAGSGSSQTSCSNSSGDICRICHCESEIHNPLLAPCYCSGSLKYVHQSCLQQWLTASETRSCELCKFNFIMHTKIKPFGEWRLLEMSGVERRRLCCAVLFHCVAALCVMWSLFVLIERAVEEVNKGQIAWPFWTKLVVVAVGFTGGAVFMYIQCRQYLHLCNRWRAHNRYAGVYHITVDPLEADIRELLALEARREARAARSLPNLRASRESLLPASASAPAPVPPS